MTSESANVEGERVRTTIEVPRAVSGQVGSGSGGAQRFKSSMCTVQITFIFIGQKHLVFGKRVCTCVMKHSNAFLNWLKNSKRVWHERKLHIMRVPLFANFDR